MKNKKIITLTATILLTSIVSYFLGLFFWKVIPYPLLQDDFIMTLITGFGLLILLTFAFIVVGLIILYYIFTNHLIKKEKNDN
jgi:hypothetical protein